MRSAQPSVSALVLVNVCCMYLTLMLGLSLLCSCWVCVKCLYSCSLFVGVGGGSMDVRWVTQHVFILHAFVARLRRMYLLGFFVSYSAQTISSQFSRHSLLMAAQPPLIAALNQLFRVVRDQDDETKRTAAAVVRGHLVSTADKATQTEPAEVRLDRLLEWRKQDKRESKGSSWD